MVYNQPRDVIGLQSYRIRWNNAKFYEAEGHSKSPTLVPIESLYASSYIRH